jgi:hypothetical protein
LLSSSKQSSAHPARSNVGNVQHPHVNAYCLNNEQYLSDVNVHYLHAVTARDGVVSRESYFQSTATCGSAG